MGTWDAVWVVLAGFVAGYLLLAALVTMFQRRLIYNPDPRRTSPGLCGLPTVREVTIEPPDGERLAAWYAPAAPGRPTVLYFHGNAGWIELRADRMADLSARGLGVLMPSYRGFGGSSGFPSEAANVADARAVYDWLRLQDVAPADIVLFGESLGTGIATQLAGAKISAGLVLDSPYTSMAELGARDYPWLPVRHLLWDKYETIRHIRRVTEPVLVIHGESDRRVPASMGHTVHAAAIGLKQIVTYPGAGHLDHRRFGSFDDVARWIAALPARQRPVALPPENTSVPAAEFRSEV